MNEPGNDPPVWAYVALGSNLGDREAYLASGMHALEKMSNTTLVAATHIEETLPLGSQQQGPYLNQMILLRTTRDPQELLVCGQDAENAAGRVRTEKWGARTLDVDLVRYGEVSLHRPDLVLPHPELANRPFWLREMAELVPVTHTDCLPSWAQITDERLEHIKRVAALVETWGIAMSVDKKERDRWVRAAWLHDALRDAPDSILCDLAQGMWNTPQLYHGPAAASMAERDGETDEDILSAVRFHTVGCEGWGTVGKMLYMADYLEIGRKLKEPELNELLARVPKDPEGVFREVVRLRRRFSLKVGNGPVPESEVLWNALGLTD